jgi:hypothetical protein
MVEAHVARIADASGKHGGVVQQRIVASLKDFAFDQLSFDLVAAGDGLDLRTHIAGRGRQVPQELDLNVNLNGFDALVDLALRVQLGLARAKEHAQQKLAPNPTKGARL